MLMAGVADELRGEKTREREREIERDGVGEREMG